MCNTCVFITLFTNEYTVRLVGNTHMETSNKDCFFGVMGEIKEKKDVFGEEKTGFFFVFCLAVVIVVAKPQ